MQRVVEDNEQERTDNAICNQYCPEEDPVISEQSRTSCKEDGKPEERKTGARKKVTSKQTIAVSNLVPPLTSSLQEVTSSPDRQQPSAEHNVCTVSVLPIAESSGIDHETGTTNICHTESEAHELVQEVHSSMQRVVEDNEQERTDNAICNQYCPEEDPVISEQSRTSCKEDGKPEERKTGARKKVTSKQTIAVSNLVPPLTSSLQEVTSSPDRQQPSAEHNLCTVSVLPIAESSGIDLETGTTNICHTESEAHELVQEVHSSMQRVVEDNEQERTDNAICNQYCPEEDPVISEQRRTRCKEGGKPEERTTRARKKVTSKETIAVSNLVLPLTSSLQEVTCSPDRQQPSAEHNVCTVSVLPIAESSGIDHETGTTNICHTASEAHELVQEVHSAMHRVVEDNEQERTDNAICNQYCPEEDPVISEQRRTCLLYTSDAAD